MISLAQLNAQLRHDIATEAGQRTENIPLDNACGRILAEEIYSQIPIPTADVSAMDGYAFQGGKTGIPAGATLKLIGTSLAGCPFSGEVKKGECVRIMTGAVVPQGSDSVEMQEYIEARGEQITFLRDGKAHNNIRYRGEELSVGDHILQKGKILQATDILLLASVGQGNVHVYMPLKVGVFSTGDELVTPGDALTQTGQIYDSNRAMIKALLSYLPVEIQDYGVIEDDLAKISAILQRAASECDVIITSGGVSVGDYDFLKTAIDQLGEIRQYKVNMKPGKPFVYGKISHAWYFGLPGNPVSSFVGFQQVIAPALWQLAGGDAPQTLVFEVPLSEPLHKREGRQDFQRGRLEWTCGKWQVSPQGRQDSHRIYGLARANCFIVLAAEDGDKTAGELVTVVPFTHCFGMGGHL